MSTPDAVRLLGISRRFGSVQALHGADFVLAGGEIHALLGENGAGKTTLMHVLFGLIQPDEGIIEIAGRSVRLGSSREAIGLGVGMVHQHNTQVDRMSVAENVWLGRPGWRTDLRAAADLVVRLGRETGLELDPLARVEQLPAAQRQRLEIIKALAREPRTLILDEPTSSLAPPEVETLFAALRRIRGQASIVLITHKLRDVAAIADRVTVLRRGRQVLTAAADAVSVDALAAAMIGEEQRPGRGPRPGRRAATGEVVLSAGDAQVRAGEIVGIAAVEGNGQRELLRGVAGIMTMDGPVIVRSPVAFIPEDRQREGLILDFSLEENLALGRTRGWRLDRRKLRADAELAIRALGIATAGPATAVRNLSGGNQQKVVLARVLAARPSLLIAENPTRGLDVHATLEVHQRLRRAADDGCGVLFYSTDLDEVLDLADRVAVIVAGRWIDVPEAQRTRERVGALMVGAA